jgi:hypothetical protein
VDELCSQLKEIGVEWALGGRCHGWELKEVREYNKIKISKTHTVIYYQGVIWWFMDMGLVSAVVSILARN